MKEPASSSPPAVRPGDVVIAVILLAVFVMGYVYAQGWPLRAALFPRLLSVAGIVLAILTLTSFGIRAYRGRRASTQALVEPVGGADDGEGQAALAAGDVEYVFGTAGARAWTASLAWIAAFFVSLWLLGVFVTVPLFAFAYLRAAAGVGWVGSLVYAVVSGGVLWLVFQQFLTVPMPTGIF